MSQNRIINLCFLWTKSKYIIHAEETASIAMCRTICVTLHWNDNIFAFDCDCVSTRGILVALKQKKKEVNKFKIICYYDITPMHSFGLQHSLNFTHIAFSQVQYFTISKIHPSSFGLLYATQMAWLIEAIGYNSYSKWKLHKYCK
jgi:hypothetical protein